MINNMNEEEPFFGQSDKDRKEAAQWLGVPIELLAAEPLGEKHIQSRGDSRYSDTR